MEVILKGLGYSQQTIDTFEREGVTPEAVTVMTTEQLNQLGINGMGRQAILMSRCRIANLNQDMPDNERARRASVQNEVSRLFSPYNHTTASHRKKKRMVTLTFMCMALPDANRIPSTFQQTVLKSAGLGEKRITIASKATAGQLHDRILSEYPKLQAGGGYEYLRTMGSSKLLAPIPLPPSGGYSAANLKAEAKQARIYIRPIQAELDVFDYEGEGSQIDNDMMEDIDEIMEKCNQCNKLVGQTKLKKHVAECNESSESTEREGNSRPVPPEQTETRPIDQPCTSSRSDSDGFLAQAATPTNRNNRDSYMDEYVDLIELSDDSDDEIKTVLQESLKDLEVNSDETALHARMQEKLVAFQQKRSEESINIIVRRKKILKSASDAISRQRDFSFLKPPVIHFSGEDAVDLGGPKREFFTMATQQLPNLGVFEGKPGNLYFSHDIGLLEKGVYKFSGQIIAWSVLHGGPGFPMIHPAVFSLMCGTEPTKQLQVGDITDVDVVHHLQTIENCSTEEMVKNAIDKSGDWAASNGCNGIFALTLQSKDATIQNLLKQHMFYRCKAEIDQFIDGMECVGGLWSVMKCDYPAFSQLMTSTMRKLDFMTLKKLFRSDWSSNALLLDKEEETILCWEEFIRQCGAGECTTRKEEKGKIEDITIGLHHILRFCTGGDAIPPTGFEKQIDIHFFTPVEHQKPYPTASTCGLYVNLPRGMTDSDAFAMLMAEAIVWSPGFGKQ